MVMPLIALLFEGMGFLVFVVSLAAWGHNFHRAKKAGILDYSMFTLHPAFLLCTVFAAVMTVSAIVYFRQDNVEGFRISIGAAVTFLSVLVWNTGFVTNAGLYMAGAKCNPLTARRENGLLLFLPQHRDPRVTRPILYENTPENREKFGKLLSHA